MKYLKYINEANTKLVSLKNYKGSVSRAVESIEKALTKHLGIKVLLTSDNDMHTFSSMYSKNLVPDRVFNYFDVKCYIYSEYNNGATTFRCKIIGKINISHACDASGTPNSQDTLYKNIGEVTFKDNGDIIKASLI